MSTAAMRASDLAAALIAAATDGADDESAALMHEAAFRIDARTHHALRGLG